MGASGVADAQCRISPAADVMAVSSWDLLVTVFSFLPGPTDFERVSGLARAS